jgi:hypothetical protein
MAILWAKDKNGADKIGSGGRRVPPKWIIACAFKLGAVTPECTLCLLVFYKRLDNDGVSVKRPDRLKICKRCPSSAKMIETSWATPFDLLLKFAFWFEHAE